MANEFEFIIENNAAFASSLDKLGKATDDFRIPLRLIASDFYRSQKQIFQLKSEGLYKPLGGKDFNAASGFGAQSKRQRAEDLKEKLTGHAWAPILFGVSGDLKDSTLGKSHQYSIFALGRQNLEIGTSVPYGIFLQGGTSVMNARPFVFITGGAGDKSADSGINGRRERWTNIIDDHVTQLITGAVLT
jgi:hypothetical protein